MVDQKTYNYSYIIKRNAFQEMYLWYSKIIIYCALKCRVDINVLLPKK